MQTSNLPTAESLGIRSDGARRRPVGSNLKPPARGTSSPHALALGPRPGPPGAPETASSAVGPSSVPLRHNDPFAGAHALYGCVCQEVDGLKLREFVLVHHNVTGRQPVRHPDLLNQPHLLVGDQSVPNGVLKLKQAA